MSKNNGYLGTKSFADLVNIPKHVLLYYDEIDLLKPHHVDQNGYRYYHRDQYYDFNVITFLKTVGVSLHEIKEYLHHRSPEALVDLLHEKESIIDSKIKELREMKRLITYIEHMTTIGMNSPSQSVRLEFRKETYVLISKKDNSQANLMDDFVEDLTQFSQKEKLTLTTFVGVRINQNHVRSGKITHYDNLFAVLLSRKTNASIISRPEGHYLVIHHAGSFETIENSYRALLEYADLHQIKLDQYFYEQTLLNDLSRTTLDQFVIEISIRCL